MNEKTVNILMAEDNEHDILAAKRAWKKHKITNPLFVVNDGEECLDFLYRRNKYQDPLTSPRPDVVLLDINMPKIDGVGVLEVIRNDEALKNLPVIMLTTSKADEDKVRCYNLGVNAYIVKPVEFDKFSGAVKAINLFWQLVEKPH